MPEIKLSYLPLLMILTVLFFSSSAATADQDIGGIWIKTTHPDPQNVAIFFVDHEVVKAIGYGKVSGKAALWYAEGKYQDGHLRLKYRYSANATPMGWEAEGTMQLDVSPDARQMSGTARSSSGGWSSRIEFIRISE